jgi:hypothetical protein
VGVAVAVSDVIVAAPSTMATTAAGTAHRRAGRFDKATWHFLRSDRSQSDDADCGSILLQAS